MNILFLGDSITEGRPGVSYVDKVAARRPDDVIVNRGVGGDTVKSIRRRILKMKDIATFDVVVLFVGVNDVFYKLDWKYPILKILMRKPWCRDLAQLKVLFQDIVADLHHRASRLIVVSPLLIGERLDNRWNTELRDVIATEQQVVATYDDVTWLDVHAQAGEFLADKDVSDYEPDRPWQVMKDVIQLDNDHMTDDRSRARGLHLTLDGVHINSTGAELLMEAILSALT